jgi:hypothetical protein
MLTGEYTISRAIMNKLLRAKSVVLKRQQSAKIDRRAAFPETTRRLRLHGGLVGDVACGGYCRFVFCC